MSFGGAKMPAEDQAMANVRERQISTNEQARPLPLLAGKQRIGVTFLTDPLKVRIDVINRSGGKGKMANSADVHANIAAALLRGPADGVHQVIFDDKVEWEGNLWRADYPTHVDIALVATRASSLRLLWGTDTQAIQNSAPVNLVDWDNNFPHPAYRGICYVILGTDTQPFYLGRNRDSVPNIEFVISRYPKPTWFTAAAAIDGECNPAAFLADLLQDVMVGPGLPDARIDAVSFNAAGATLEAEGFGISPVITRAQGLRQIVADLCALIDGYLFVTGDGKLGLGLVRTGGALPVVDETKLVERLAFDPQGWTRTLNGVSVAFANRDDGYVVTPESYHDGGNYQITQVNRREVLSREWITKAEIAKRLAVADGAKRGLPMQRGTAVVRRSVGKNLTPGTVFQLDYAEQGLSGFKARVEKQRLPGAKGAPGVEIDWVVDRSYLNADFFTPVTTTFPAAGVTIVGAARRVMEWPWMRDFNLPLVAILTTRTETAVGSYVAHVAKPSGSYEEMEVSSLFVQWGAVADANYPVTDSIDGSIGIVVEMGGVDKTLPTGGTLEDALLDDWVAVVNDEIIGLWGGELLAAGKYRFKTIRGLWDTKAAAHVVGDGVFVFRLRNAPLFPAENAMATQAYKVQEIVRGSLGSLSGALNLTTSHRWERPLEPQNLAAFGDVANPTYSSGQDIPLTWSVTNKKRVGFWEVWDDGWLEDSPETVLEFWTTAGTMVATIEIAPNFGDESDSSPAGNSYTVANASLVSWFGSQVTFDVRAYHRLNGYRSARYDLLRVTKI